MANIEPAVEFFEKDFNTKFKVLNQQVIFSEERRVYVRACESSSDVTINKEKLESLTTARGEPDIQWLEEGYNEGAELYCLVYT